MNRRIAIRNMALVLGGAVLLPSCLNSNGKKAVQLKHIILDEDQQSLIAQIAETIIPKTTTPGAKELKLPDFVLLMLDDCYNKKDQQTILDGLDKFKDYTKSKYNNPFNSLDNKTKEAVLIDIEKSAKAKKSSDKNLKDENKVDSLNFFFSAIKQQTIFGYTTSQYFMTKQIVYELVPGRYNVHVPVKQLKTA